MARSLRIEFENAVYHITARGNERKKIFRDKEDYEKLLEILGEAKKKYSLVVYCYALMPNHYHFVIKTLEENLSKAMHFIQTSYTIYFNYKYERAGHLFQGRYKALLVDKDNYLLELSRYVHLNVLRAGIVKQIEEYEWTSFQEYVGLRASGLVDTEMILSQFGNKKSISYIRYREFCYSGGEIKWDKFKKNIYSGIILGAKEFKEKIEEKIRKMELSKEIPFTEDIKTGKSGDKILKRLDRFYQEDEIFKKRGEARKVAIYLLKKYTDMSLDRISELFGGLHYSSISKIVTRLENQRKVNLKLDKKLCQIEKEI